MLLYGLFAFQLASLGIVLYLILRITLALREREATSAAPPALSPDLRQDLADVIAELRRTAEQINRDLTARSQSVRRQLEEVERRIAALEEAVRPAEVTAAETRAQVAAEQLELGTPASSSRPETAAPNGIAESRPIDLRKAGRYQQVFRLAEEGLSSLEIARRAQLGREEVELVLGLRNEGKKTE